MSAQQIPQGYSSVQLHLSQGANLPAHPTGKPGSLVFVRAKGGPGVLDSLTPHLLDPHKHRHSHKSWEQKLILTT